MNLLQLKVFLDDAREFACYRDNSPASCDAEWLLFNARSLVQAEHDGDAVYILCLAEARQKRIQNMGYAVGPKRALAALFSPKDYPSFTKSSDAEESARYHIKPGYDTNWPVS